MALNVLSLSLQRQKVLQLVASFWTLAGGGASIPVMKKSALVVLLALALSGCCAEGDQACAERHAETRHEIASAVLAFTGAAQPGIVQYQQSSYQAYQEQDPTVVHIDQPPTPETFQESTAPLAAPQVKYIPVPPEPGSGPYGFGD